MDRVHLFSQDTSEVQTRIVKRGRNESSKYFIVPRELRDELNIGGNVTCQRIETKDITVFVYMVSKY